MTNLWDKPAPGPADLTPDAVYMGVGAACSAWEKLEGSLAELYSAYIGQPYQARAIREYGRTKRSCAGRLRALAAAGECYHVNNCSQHDEGRLRSLIATTSRLLVRRNQIVHGVVIRLMLARSESGKLVHFSSYCVTSPSQAYDGVTHGEGQYYYGSFALGVFSENFLEIANEVTKLTNDLSPPPVRRPVPYLSYD